MMMKIELTQRNLLKHNNKGSSRNSIMSGFLVIPLTVQSDLFT